jgi:hypothetical protein
MTFVQILKDQGLQLTFVHVEYVSCRILEVGLIDQ